MPRKAVTVKRRTSRRIRAPAPVGPYDLSTVQLPGGTELQALGAGFSRENVKMDGYISGRRDGGKIGYQKAATIVNTHVHVYSRTPMLRGFSPTAGRAHYEHKRPSSSSRAHTGPRWSSSSATTASILPRRVRSGSRLEKSPWRSEASTPGRPTETHR